MKVPVPVTPPGPSFFRANLFYCNVMTLSQKFEGIALICAGAVLSAFVHDMLIVWRALQ